MKNEEPKPDPLKQKAQLRKYHLALSRTLESITGKTVPDEAAFRELETYSQGWHKIGLLAIAIWEQEAFHPQAFEAHPGWEAAANTTFEFLVEHCSNCGVKQLDLKTVIFCQTCRRTVSEDQFQSVMDGPVAQEVLAFAEELLALETDSVDDSDSGYIS